MMIMKKLFLALIMILAITGSARAFEFSYPATVAIITYAVVDTQPCGTLAAVEVSNYLQRGRDMDWWQAGLMVAGGLAIKEGIDELAGRHWSWDDMAFGMAGWAGYNFFRWEW
jgi:hypothetical protein